MSRKHAPAPDTDVVTLAKAIGWRLHDLRAAGQVPCAIIMDEATAVPFHVWGIGGWSYGRPELFCLPVEIDARTAGWSVKVKP